MVYNRVSLTNVIGVLAMVQFFFSKTNLPMTLIVSLIIMAWLSLFSVVLFA